MKTLIVTRVDKPTNSKAWKVRRMNEMLQTTENCIMYAAVDQGPFVGGTRTTGSESDGITKVEIDFTDEDLWNGDRIHTLMRLLSQCKKIFNVVLTTAI